MPATSTKSSEAYKITLRLLALMPRLMSTCKICGVIKLVSVTTSKLVKAPNVTGQYFRKYPRARQRSPIASRLSTAMYHLLRLLIQTQQVIQVIKTLQMLKSVKLLNRPARQPNEITRTSVGADLSCPSPIHRPVSVDVTISRCKCYSALLACRTDPASIWLTLLTLLTYAPSIKW